MKSSKSLSSREPDGPSWRALPSVEAGVNPEIGSNDGGAGSGGGSPDIRRPPPPGVSGTARDTAVSDEPFANVLVVEDDPELLSAVRRYLYEKRLLVTAVQDGNEAVRLLLDSDDSYDAVVLDILLPGLDGREVCCQVRGAGCWVPIMMVTALGEIDDRIEGFQRGADDYLVKPFSLEELSLRLRALIRRSGATWVWMLSVGDLQMNLQTRQAWRGEVELNLTHREFQLLELFLRHPGLVLSRNIIRTAVWGASEAKDVSGNLIDQYIAHLRRKIDRPSSVSSIETLSRVGYRLRTAEND